VLDTSVLVHDPDAIDMFPGEVAIPITVVEELDGLKKDPSWISYAARKALRRIDALRGNGGIGHGNPLPNGGSLRVHVGNGGPAAYSEDDRIITMAGNIKNSSEGDRVILVTKDTAMRIKAEAVGVETEDYQEDKAGLFRKYGRVLEAEDYSNGIESVRYQTSGERIFRLWGRESMIPIKRQRAVMGISPRNREQECSMDALLSDEISVVALTGQAGSGKTLLALAAGLFLYERKRFEQVMVSRPVVPMGSDLGYLPGDIDDKIRPWMHPIFDNLEVIVGTPNDRKDGACLSRYRSPNYLVESGAVHHRAVDIYQGKKPSRQIPNSGRGPEPQAS
jgi:PhoH-like ATPase